MAAACRKETQEIQASRQTEAEIREQVAAEAAQQLAAAKQQQQQEIALLKEQQQQLLDKRAKVRLYACKQ